MLKSVLTILIICSVAVQGERIEMSFQNGFYILGYEVDPTGTFIVVDALARTTGYVGFGVSNRDGFGMPESDIIIAGFDEEDGFNYIGDFHAFVNGPPVLDERQDVTLLDVRQRDGTTFVQFRRLLKTGDPNPGQDVDIDGSTFILWSMGNTDVVQYHIFAGKVSQPQMGVLPPFKLPAVV